MPKIHIIISFIFLIFFTHKVESKKLIESLQETCPTFSYLKGLFEAQKGEYQSALQNSGNKEDVEESDYIDEDLVNRLNNIQNLCQGLVGDMVPLGQGSFGKVYQTSIQLEDLDHLLTVVAKVVRVLNNADNEDDQEEQELFELEIEANRILNELDVENYFFPELFDAVNITDYVDSLDKSDLDETQTQNVAHTEEQDMFAIFTEQLNFELLRYIELMEQNDNFYIVPVEERLNLALLAIKGLVLMQAQYFHCDIKPENMMFKKVDPETLRAMIQAGLTPVQLMPGDYYQIKYIDFGLVAEGELSKRECMGGTNGYKPDEYFNGETNLKFDIYSLGMTLLDLELSIRGQGFFSDIDSYIFKTKKAKQSTFSEEIIQKLENKGLVKRMKQLMEHPKYKVPFRTELAKQMPKLDDFIKNSFPMREAGEVASSEFLYMHVDLFRRMMLIAIRMYFFEYTATHSDKQAVDYFQSRLDQATANFTNPPKEADKKKYEAEMNYYKSKVPLARGRNELRLKLVGIFLNMIERNHAKRPTIEQLEQFFVEEVANFRSTYGDYLEDVVLYEEELPDDQIYVKPDLNKLSEKIFENFQIKANNFEKNRVKAKVQINYQRFNTQFIRKNGQAKFII